MAELSNLVELVSSAGVGAIPAAATAGGLMVLGAWRLWTPRRDALPPLVLSAPPSMGEAALGQPGAGADPGLLGLRVPGGGE